jgi:hypothetical protein
MRQTFLVPRRGSITSLNYLDPLSCIALFDHSRLHTAQNRFHHLPFGVRRTASHQPIDLATTLPSLSPIRVSAASSSRSKMSSSAAIYPLRFFPFLGCFRFFLTASALEALITHIKMNLSCLVFETALVLDVKSVLCLPLHSPFQPSHLHG